MWNSCKQKFKEIRGCKRIYIQTYIEEFLKKSNKNISNDRVPNCPFMKIFLWQKIPTFMYTDFPVMLSAENIFCYQTGHVIIKKKLKIRGTYAILSHGGLPYILHQIQILLFQMFQNLDISSEDEINRDLDLDDKEEIESHATRETENSQKQLIPIMIFTLLILKKKMSREKDLIVIPENMVNIRIEDLKFCYIYLFISMNALRAIKKPFLLNSKTDRQIGTVLKRAKKKCWAAATFGRGYFRRPCGGQPNERPLYGRPCADRSPTKRSATPLILLNYKTFILTQLNCDQFEKKCINFVQQFNQTSNIEKEQREINRSITI
ncbi:hypothetical protein BpHYR1_015632 [Brachionus plicatilis]|uniref:Uncharacterized protein n=1 Tax=Brachionus plicatilis TaxID=10195 RepID=A0A3M7PZE9_BRAPC|nr:hypothetical protein BpHYR1_015632 [Brachionus plicatilis]